MKRFTDNMRPHVMRQLAQSELLMSDGKPESAFKHLENAHVLGQNSTYLHVLAHVRMARWAIHQNKAAEFFGQILRIFGAATKTFIGLVPTGNTGGSNISPFKPLPLSAEHRRLIEHAKIGTKL